MNRCSPVMVGLALFLLAAVGSGAAPVTAPAATSAWGQPESPGSLVWKVPGDVPEMMAACKNIPSMYNFSRDGYKSIECGYQAILLGSRIPIAPAPHIPWARPYAKGPIKALIVAMFGNAPCDTRSLAQLTREGDLDARWVLIADTATHATWGGEDDAYRLGFLADQARAALQEDYDVIVMALGTYSPNFGYPIGRNSFPDDVYQTILAKVKAGTGLILVGSNMGGWWVEKTPLLEASPATMTGSRRQNEPVASAGPDLDFLQGAPIGDLPVKPEGAPAYAAWPVYSWKLREGAQVAAQESGQPLVIAGTYGQGRTVLLGWDGTLGPVRSVGAPMMYEHGLATSLRALAYAAKKEPPVKVLPRGGQLSAGQPGSVLVSLSGPAELNWTVRNPDFETLAEGKTKAAAGDAPVALPALPSGDFWLDVIARDSKGASLGWGSARFAVRGNFQWTAQTDKESYKLGETVVVSGTAPAGENRRVEVEISDAMGRVLARGKAEGVEQYSFRYPVADARVPLHYATVCLYQGQNLLGRQKPAFYVPMSTWDDYHNALWPHDPGDMLPQTREVAGITGVMDSWGGQGTWALGAKVGILPFRMNDGVLGPAEVQKDPVAAEKANETPFAQSLEAARRYGCIGWAMQDERHAMSDAGMPNEEGLKRFRAYLQQQYGTLEKLNASWDSQWKNWEEIAPTLTPDLTPETKNLAPWVDFRLYVADQVYQIDKRHVERIREVVGPEARVGIDGFTTSGHQIPYGATNIGRYLAEGVFNFYCPYGDDLLIASMNPGPTVKYIGWGMAQTDYMGYPWRDAFRGHWGTFRFFGSTFLSDFGWVQPAGAWIERGTRELREGTGKLLMGAKRQTSPVAILYSYPSMISSAGAGVWVEKGNAHLMWRPANWSRECWERMLTQNGLSFSYVSDEQAEQGGLAGKKLLVLTHFMAMSLSDKTCAAIKDFVAKGGVVVADLAPAVCDEHGKPRATGGLDDLFGVSRTGLTYTQRYPDYLVGIVKDDPLVPKNGWWIGQWYEKDLKVTDGTALGNHWFVDVPAFVAKNTGQGRALLLNFLHTAVVKRNGEPEDDELKLMQYLLRGAGVSAPAAMETDYGVTVSKPYEINVLKEGANEYVGVYCLTTPENPEKMVIRFPAARETYDVRAGRYLGKVAEAPAPIRAYGAALLARLDYQVTGLKLGVSDVARGGALPVSLELQTSAAPGRHVVHLEVTAPDGKRELDYCRNVELREGKYRGAIHTALNDQAGTWTIAAREVVSGKRATAKFRLR